ncbi:MAG: molybdopterin-dependent oxidoreductase [Theionarchaea archaeon]|nr:molybdopterin-dependent oxidoreductase [Theionarchaea archaeon]
MKKGFVFLVVLLTGCIGQQVEPDVTGEITPLEDFFVVDLGIKPDIDIAEWRLEVVGLVDNPLILTYEDILEYPSVTQVTHLQCVMAGFEGTGEWTGVPLKYILEKAQYQESVISVIFHAADEYTSSIDLETALQEDTILAYKINGVTLPEEHGYPLRLVIPDKLGYKWVKWIVKIELVDYEYEGYWESRGYSNTGNVREIV